MESDRKDQEGVGEVMWDKITWDADWAIGESYCHRVVMAKHPDGSVTLAIDERLTNENMHESQESILLRAKKAL